MLLNQWIHTYIKHYPACCQYILQNSNFQAHEAETQAATAAADSTMPDLSDVESPSPSPPQTYASPPPNSQTSLLSTRDPLSIDTPTAAHHQQHLHHQQPTTTSLNNSSADHHLQGHDHLHPLSHHNPHHTTSSLLIPDYSSYTVNTVKSGLHNGIGSTGGGLGDYTKSSLQDYVKPTSDNNTFRPFLPTSTTSSAVSSTPNSSSSPPIVGATTGLLLDEDPYKLMGGGSAGLVGGGVGVGHTSAPAAADWHSSLYSSTYPHHHHVHPPPKLTPSPFISNYLHPSY